MFNKFVTRCYLEQPRYAHPSTRAQGRVFLKKSDSDFKKMLSPARGLRFLGGNAAVTRSPEVSGGPLRAWVTDLEPWVIKLSFNSGQ